MQYDQLLRKKLLGKLSPEEAHLFQQWLSISEENQQLYNRLLELHREGVSIPHFDGQQPSALWKQLLQKVEERKRRRLVRKKFIYRYAAIFVGLLGLLGAYFLWISDKYEQQTPSSGIALELSNGQIYSLTEIENEELLDENGKLLGIKKEGRLVYSGRDTDQTLLYHTLHVPNGKQFELQLSDGTYVHVNAGSSVRYPVNFVNKEVRKVFLTGEAYFEVVRNKRHPFVVTNGDVDIQVLGTQFNVSAYADDLEVGTVLVEGAIRLSESGQTNDVATTLAPGQKATWNKEAKKLSLKEVDVQRHISWREGKLIFRKVDFKSITKQLQRKYNVQIDNRYSALDERIFSATFDEETIEEVLDTFVEETYFEYYFKNEKIIINTPNEHLKQNANE